MEKFKKYLAHHAHELVEKENNSASLTNSKVKKFFF